MLDWRQSGDDPRDATVAPASCVQRKDYFFADFAGATVDAPRDDDLDRHRADLKFAVLFHFISFILFSRLVESEK